MKWFSFVVDTFNPNHSGVKEIFIQANDEEEAYQSFSESFRSKYTHKLGKPKAYQELKANWVTDCFQNRIFVPHGYTLEIE